MLTPNTLHVCPLQMQRYGLLLSAEELSSFEPLRDNYEVDYYLQQAQAAVQQQRQQPQQPQQLPQVQQQQHASSTVKNRRLAFMRRLEQQGEYFSEHSMRERQPLVWQECIGAGHGAMIAFPAFHATHMGVALASHDGIHTPTHLFPAFSAFRTSRTFHTLSACSAERQPASRQCSVTAQRGCVWQLNTASQHASLAHHPWRNTLASPLQG